MLQMLCSGVSLLWSQMEGDTTLLLNNIFAGTNAPMNTFCLTDDPTRLDALQALQKVMDEFRSVGIGEDALMRLEAAENRVKAVEMEQMFCYAVRYGARLQRELDAVLDQLR